MAEQPADEGPHEGGGDKTSGRSNVTMAATGWMSNANTTQVSSNKAQVQETACEQATRPRTYAEATAPAATTRLATEAAKRQERKPREIFLGATPGKYNEAAILEFANLCNKCVQRLTELRKPAQREKDLIAAIIDTTVTVRALPDFFAQLFTSDQLLSFIEFFKNNVEGELFTKLPPHTQLSDLQLTTSRLAFVIETSTTNSGGACDHVAEMLNEVKSISFDRHRRTLHFRFFDRASVAKDAGKDVPFRNSQLRLFAVTDSSDSDSTPSLTCYQLRYSLRLFNVAVHIEPRMLFEYIKTRSEYPSHNSAAKICEAGTLTCRRR